MLGLTIAASLAIGFIVAAGFVGRETRKLSTQPRQPVWRLEEAAVFVEGELPFDFAAKTDPDTLRELLRIHLNQLQFTTDPDQAADPSAALQNLYRYARSQDIEITRPTVEAILAALLQYLKLIGALGTTRTSE